MIDWQYLKGNHKCLTRQQIWDLTLQHSDKPYIMYFRVRRANEQGVAASKAWSHQQHQLLCDPKPNLLSDPSRGIEPTETNWASFHGIACTWMRPKLWSFFGISCCGILALKRWGRAREKTSGSSLLGGLCWYLNMNISCTKLMVVSSSFRIMKSLHSWLWKLQLHHRKSVSSHQSTHNSNLTLRNQNSMT